MPPSTQSVALADAVPGRDTVRLAASLGHQLRLARKAHGLSQGQLGRACDDADQTTVSNWEKGSIPLERIVQVEDALRLPPGTLLVRAGYVPDRRSFQAAVLADPTLEESDRQALLKLYAALSSGTRRGSESA